MTDVIFGTVAEMQRKMGKMRSRFWQGTEHNKEPGREGRVLFPERKGFERGFNIWRRPAQ
jgi:hypothetical protein